VVGVVVGGEAGQGASQVGEWDAGQGGEVVAGGRAEVEFSCRQGALAGQGDADAVEEMVERQPVGDSEALDI
jgi:hypothetical protein